MADIDEDLQKLEQAMRLLFQSMKRPQSWARITTRAGVELDRPAAGILFALINHQTGRYRLQDIAADLAIEAPSVTRKSQELEQAGYVQRVRDEKDKRAFSLQVTPQGKAVARKLRSVQRQDLAAVLCEWDGAEREQFIDLFERFAQHMTRQSNDGKLQKII